jgi:hypothetical protein
VPKPTAEARTSEPTATRPGLTPFLETQPMSGRRA